MPMSLAQLATFRAHIQANAGVFTFGPFSGQTVQAVAATVPRASEVNIQIAVWYNQTAAPAFVAWRSAVATAEVGRTVNYVAVEAMTDANRTRITTFYVMNPVSFQPRADIRTFWDNTFAGALGGEGANTRAALESLWRRSVTYGERVFATGTGTTNDPGELVYEGQVSPGDVDSALAN